VYMTTLKRNRIKYNNLYKNGYPHGGLGFPITWSGINRKYLRCLDVGCGCGLLGRQFKDYVGIDISDYVIAENKKKYSELDFVVMDAKDLNNKFGKYDIVIALDVLEHFPKEEINVYLKAISKVDTEVFLFSICCRESAWGGHRDLHTCLMSMEQWLDLLKKYFKITDSSELNRQQTFCVKAEKL
jgi:2-polyprenyl-3-methyl-5-hydroxy-6-metoxy-1,4-benzoquinol methylase